MVLAVLYCYILIKPLMNKNKIGLIFDKYANWLYTFIKDCFDNEKFILYINKFIYKFTLTNKKFLNSKIDYKFLNLFNKILLKTIKILKETKSINIIVSKIAYPNLLIQNKLIIKINNLRNTIIYLPHINDVQINLSNAKDKFIHLSSKNIEYVTNLASLIKNIKKIDVCTHVGMYYSDEKIIIRKRKSQKKT
ncbi:hypothetical protein TpMuguga_05g00012 (apicoplast) [Theileria parva strain Muguga]|uniref:Ribosomal protein L6, putative n=1 Tax=Theileria parva TaxID=5875 RepID=Q4MYB1_THEPA|nr:hypothetical protein TpMuguga_05g00012 [Theileria parva strain Muguga]|eukprot:XP_762681.1 ribosomal protein L6 (apicoplast) [Theileria parva strain Muguga]